MVSKVPLPDYRADLDERHGSTQKEVSLDLCCMATNYNALIPQGFFFCSLQIKMSTETADRVGSLLCSSQSQGEVSANVASGSRQGSKQTSASINASKPVSQLEPDTVKEKEKLSLQLKERQEKMKVRI